MRRQAILLFRSQQEPVMNSFYDHHKDSIRFNYRCFNRILLNGLIHVSRLLTAAGDRATMVG